MPVQILGRSRPSPASALGAVLGGATMLAASMLRWIDLRDGVSGLVERALSNCLLCALNMGLVIEVEPVVYACCCIRHCDGPGWFAVLRLQITGRQQASTMC
jgi:hypothetical protein